MATDAQINVKRAQNNATDHILAAINSDGFEGCDYFNPCNTEEEKAKFSKARFLSEYEWHVKQVGELKAVESWLQGLALNIDFYNHDIIRNAKAWGSLADDASEREEGVLLDKYWRYMAMRLIALWRKYGV